MNLINVSLFIVISAAGVSLELYSIKHDLSKLCLAAAETENSTFVTLQSCNGEPCQIWDRQPTLNGTYFIINAANGQYLNYQKNEDKRYILTASKENDVYEEWWRLPTGEIINLYNKEEQLKITINHAAAIGERLLLCPKNMPLLQRFIFEPVHPHTTSEFSTILPTTSGQPTSTTKQPKSDYSIIKMRYNPNLVLDARDNEAVRLQYFTGSLYQQWREVHTSQGKFIIYNRGNDKVLDLATDTFGSNIVTKHFNREKNQNWMLDYNGLIVHDSRNNLTVSVFEGNVKYDVKAVAFPRFGGYNQQFEFEYVHKTTP